MMEISVHEVQANGPVTVLQITGDIDITTSDALLAQARASAAGGAQRLLLDLSHVGYLSSAGIRVLHQIFLLLHPDATAERKAELLAGVRSGGYVSAHLKLAHPTPRVEEALRSTGMDMYLTMYPTVEAALAAY